MQKVRGKAAIWLRFFSNLDPSWQFRMTVGGGASQSILTLPFIGDDKLSRLAWIDKATTSIERDISIKIADCGMKFQLETSMQLCCLLNSRSHGSNCGNHVRRQKILS